ncbi:hypothetical protein ACEWY4_019086 [Coilia grayii]|uniref:C1q domain-containing protein n=1 Tax=Coilia grayii TaxID=363190 RepID=A0ABD1JF31_9TELE
MKTPGAVLLLLWLGLLVGAAESGDIDLLELKYLRSQVQDFESRLQVSEKKARNFETRLKASEDYIVNLQKRDEGMKVAFSLSLEQNEWRYSGPYNTGTTLIYKQVFLNIGNAYSPSSGYFTAPVRGVYDFSFYAYGEGNSDHMGAVLRVNKQTLVMAYGRIKEGYGDADASNGVSVLLEKGDEVDVYLPANHRVHDNNSHHSTFRGHLLFQM